MIRTMGMNLNRFRDKIIQVGNRDVGGGQCPGEGALKPAGACTTVIAERVIQIEQDE